VHSTTKYLSGHSDIIGGIVTTSNERIYHQVKFYQNAAGAVPGPWDSWLVLRGIKDNLVRLSVGIENKIDLKEDLQKALS